MMVPAGLMQQLNPQCDFFDNHFFFILLHDSVQLWSKTSCPGKFTENYLKDRLYGNTVLDCDRVCILL